LSKNEKVAVALEVKTRAAALRQIPPAELRALPNALSDDSHVFGTAVSFSTFSDLYPDGRTFFIVRSEYPIFGGLLGAGTSDGFWLDRDGATADATSEELIGLLQPATVYMKSRGGVAAVT
jgi:hypothetical protein